MKVVKQKIVKNSFEFSINCPIFCKHVHEILSHNVVLWETQYGWNNKLFFVIPNFLSFQLKQSYHLDNNVNQTGVIVRVIFAQHQKRFEYSLYFPFINVGTFFGILILFDERRRESISLLPIFLLSCKQKPN